jgi:pimeloyl-ACP methyl ester carboxylesterase
MTQTGTRQRVEGAGLALAVSEWGDRNCPTVILLHGYPDTHAVWQDVAPLLAEHFHVVAYDVRGAGESDAPKNPAHYGLDWLAKDFMAVAAAVAPGRKVHLVGHDWGSIQGWHFAADPLAERHMASLTSISGPPLDYAREWIQGGFNPFAPEGLAQRLDQLARSWYLGALGIPGLAEILWPALGPLWPQFMAQQEGVVPHGDHPSLGVAADAVRGAWLYRVNIAGAFGKPAPGGPPRVPVQLIVPTRDHFVSPRLYDGIERYAPGLKRREIAAGHWLPRTHPTELASWVEAFCEPIEAAKNQEHTL